MEKECDKAARNYLLIQNLMELLLFIEEMKEIVKAYFDRMLLCENQKWDLEHEVRKREYEVIIRKP